MYLSHRDPNAHQQIAEELLRLTRRLPHPQPYLPVFMLIGSDHPTWDTLGPITGWMLDKAGFRGTMFGSVHEPVDNGNVCEVLAEATVWTAQHHRREAFVIAVDAGCSQLEPVGSIKVASGGIRPGEALNQSRCIVGHVHVAGVTVRSGLVAEYAPLGMVMDMAEVIAKGLIAYQAAWENNMHSRIVIQTGVGYRIG